MPLRPTRNHSRSPVGREEEVRPIIRHERTGDHAGLTELWKKLRGILKRKAEPLARPEQLRFW